MLLAEPPNRTAGRIVISVLVAVRESMTAAAADLANIGSSVNAAHMAAAPPTVSVISAAGDEVSSGIAHVFSQYAQHYQAMAGQAAALHEQFVQRLTSSAGSYANAETANAAMVQPLAAGSGPAAVAAATTGQQVLDSLQNTFILLTALATVPFYILMISPFLPIVGIAYVLQLLVGPP